LRPTGSSRSASRSTRRASGGLHAVVWDGRREGRAQSLEIHRDLDTRAFLLKQHHRARVAASPSARESFRHLGEREISKFAQPPYNGARISLRQGKARRGSKLGPLIEIPCTSALRRMLDGMDRVSPLILTTKTGQSFKK
jgi:hypothetical protein